MPGMPAAKSPADSPTAAAHALPAWVYANPDLQRLEIERILIPSWQIACHVNSIAHPGDFVTLDLGPESVFVLRSREGRIRAFHNVCRHRGARLLDGTGNCPTSITCPYHGWSYRHDGALIGVPSRESFPGLDRSAHALNEVRTETAFGFVFVALGGDPAPVAATWQPFLAELAPYRIEEMVPLGPISLEHWDVDWKLAMDNYLESYHVPIGHPGLNRMFTPDYEDMAVAPTIARGTSWLREQESSRWSERMYQRLVGHIGADLPQACRRSWRFYSALPNLGIDLFAEQMDFFQVIPRGPGKCTIRSGVFGRPDSSREMRLVRFLGSRINAQVNAEDRRLCGRVQRGLASRSYRPGPLSGLESCMLEFHELLRRRIPEFRLPEAPSSFAGLPTT
ncbi:MAG TPA: aromatic ring-hydroxylating dioxygenase subunit alpha [Steroidobacteraceae bacterium]|nr:aromatic ring-hydroxylating dioxygenase subunit alpha [Steroidobacteraceae bacterium]